MTSIKVALSLILISLLTGCFGADRDNIPLSSEFATSAITAHYKISATGNNTNSQTLLFEASFNHRGDVMELDDGDTIKVENGIEQYRLFKVQVDNDVSYMGEVRIDNLPTNLTFNFSREYFTSANFSTVSNADIFQITNLSDEDIITLENDNSFTILWDNNASANAQATRMHANYQLNCRHESGTPSLNKSFSETIDDDGQHQVDFDQFFQVEDYSLCSRVDVTLTRRRTGNLDANLKDGSTSGERPVSVNRLVITL